METRGQAVGRQLIDPNGPRRELSLRVDLEHGRRQIAITGKRARHTTDTGWRGRTSASEQRVDDRRPSRTPTWS